MWISAFTDILAEKEKKNCWSCFNIITKIYNLVKLSLQKSEQLLSAAMKCKLGMKRSLRMGWNQSFLLLTHLHNVIIKQQPEAVALHNGDVVPTVWATAKKGFSFEKKELIKNSFDWLIDLALKMYYPGVTSIPRITSGCPSFSLLRFLDLCQIASIKICIGKQKIFKMQRCHKYFISSLRDFKNQNYKYFHLCFVALTTVKFGMKYFISQQEFL